MRVASAMLAALVACSHPSKSSPSPDSGGFPFAALQPRIEVTSEVNSTGAWLVVEASFSGGALDGGYSLMTTYQGTNFDVAILNNAMPYPPWYQYLGQLQINDDPSGKAIAVTLTHGDMVATSTVTMPGGFSITSVTGSLNAFPITATWSPTSTDAIAWAADGENEHGFVCATGGASVAPDAGTVTIQSSAIFVQATASPCGGLIDINRSRPGTIDTQFAGGSIIASQMRIVSSGIFQ